MSMADHFEAFAEVEIYGILQNPDEKILELDLVLRDHQGVDYAMNVMTLGRYQDAVKDQPDIGYDEDAARIYIVNEPEIAYESLYKLLKTVDKTIFSPYVQTIN